MVVAEWMERAARESPGMDMMRTSSEKVYPAIVLSFADDDFAPVFGQAFDALPHEMRRDVAMAIAKECVRDPFLRERFESFSIYERLLRQDPARPLTSFGYPAAVDHIRKTRVLRHQVAADLAALAAAQTFADTDALAISLSAAAAQSPVYLWPSEAAAIQKALDERRGTLALAAAKADHARLTAITDGKERLAALKTVIEGRTPYHTYLTDEARAALLARAAADQDALFAERLQPVLASLDALPPEFASLEALNDRVGQSDVEVMLLRPELQAQWRERTNAAEERILQSLIDAELVVLERNTPDRAGLQDAAAWMRDFSARFQAYRERQEYKDASRRFSVFRSGQLKASLPAMEAELAQAPGATALDEIVNAYLSAPGDRNLPVALEILIVAEGYKGGQPNTP
jgi:hypothetical protein